MLWVISIFTIFGVIISILLFKSLQNKYQLRKIDHGIQEIYIYISFLEKFYTTVNNLLKPLSIAKIYVLSVFAAFLLNDSPWSLNLLIYSLAWPGDLINSYTSSTPNC